MANQNLSQFGEKLFVADADHTFIWDSAASISKRVSRNSWLNSGTLTSDAPVTISQTWNAVGQTFKALVVNAAGTSGTNSASGSLLLDLQSGGLTQFSVRKDGFTLISGTGLGVSNIFTTGGGLSASIIASGINVVSTLSFNGNTFLVYDGAANTLALRNGAAAQAFNVYGTYTSGTSYERLTLSAPSAANAIIGTNKGSGGGTARGLEFQTDGVTRMTLSATASAVTFTNGINAGSGSNSIFNFTSSLAMYLTAGGYGASATMALFSPSDGVLRLTNGATTDFNRLQFGGTTDAFPAVARDGAGIKFTGAAAGSTSWIKVPPVAVTALPDATVAGAGARAFVNDASSPTFGSAVTGGGAVLVPVYSTGSAWHVG